MLKGLNQSRPAEHLGVEPLGGQEHHAEIRGGGRADVLVANVLRVVADLLFELPECLIRRGRVARVLGVQQPLVVCLGELGVDGQPDDVLPFVPPGQADGELHPFAAALLRGHVAVKLLRRQHLREQRFKLHLAPGAAGLDVGQHLLEVAHADGQRLHLAEPLVDLLQPLADQPERLAQAFLQRALELLVHGLPHLVEAFGVVFLDGLEPGVDRIPQAFDLFLVGLGQLRQALGKRIQLALLQLTNGDHLLADRVVGGFLRTCQFFP